MKKIWFLLIITFTNFFWGQDNQPKVGLVLSGGGAKGIAHIGVLKEIEKAGFQIDYIGGTSMGAVIGGLYASGYSANQIEDIITKTDFGPLLRDIIPRSASPFFEKEHGEKTKITFPVNKGSIDLPKGVSRGQNILNLLYELLDANDNVGDFSKLPIPFFCIATDIENGEQVVIEKGSLAKALRASASFPTVLNPVEFDGKLLVDGGITNNFPVSVMKSKNIDIVIGVNVESELFERDQLTSVVVILNQIINYQMYDKSTKEKNQLDIYIKPDVLGFSVLDFDKKLELVKRGTQKAKEFQKVFQEIAAKQKIKKVRRQIEINNSKNYISKINLFGSKNYTRSYVLGKLNIKTGDSLSRQDITKRIQLLSATKNYDKISYKLCKDENNGMYILDFHLKESNQNASISLGLHYDHLYKSSLLANYQQKHALLNNDLLSLNFMLGDNLRYDLNYFVDNGFYFSYGFNSRYNHFNDNTKFDVNKQGQISDTNVNLDYSDFTNQLFIQTTFNRKFALGLGLEHKFLKITNPNLMTNNEETIIDKSSYYSSFGFIKIDTYDEKYFVKKGFYADLNFKLFFDSTDFNGNFKSFSLAKGTLGFATTFWDKFTFQFTNEAGFTFNNPTSKVFDFYLGGYNQNYINSFISLYGYEFAYISDKSFVKSEFNFRYNISNKHYAMFIANYARLDDNVFKDIDLFKDILSGYAFGYSYNSIVGPIEIKYSWSPGSNQNYLLFNLGFWF